MPSQPNNTQAILPGPPENKTIGILGKGQLGKMTAQAAQAMGYRVVALGPDSDAPASAVAHSDITAAYDDREALQRFAEQVDVVTVEFENIPAESLSYLAEHVPVHPSASVLKTAQHRLTEKSTLRDLGFPVTPFCHIQSEQDLAPALEKLGLPAVLKTTGFGYDGKGQVKITDAKQASAAFQQLGTEDAILEQWVSYQAEISIIGARNLSGEFSAFGPIENQHHNHILDLSFCPAPILDKLPASLANQAIAMTRSVMEKLDVIGLLCVEFFITTEGTLLINELAPRPHNSGHYSIDACPTSQFEQHVRAICNLPLGETTPHTPAVMINLLGDLWINEAGKKISPDWQDLLKNPHAHLHLYGKTEPKPGRKMGHITTTYGDPTQAVALAETLKSQLDKPTPIC